MSDPLFDLSGRVALVTGSTQGLGEATARVFAEHGAHVLISSRRAEACEEVAARLREAGLSAEGFACNIGHEAAIEKIYEHIEKKHGRLDILVNNAVLSPWRSIEETDRALMMKALETNTAGYWYMSTKAVSIMKRQGKGSIINVSSTGAWRPTPNLALYATFKASLDGMTKAFANEFGGFGIRVNTILPGLFETELANAFTPEVKRDVVAKTPLGRLGAAPEIGHAALFLAADASAFVTGTSLVVDGGQFLR